jgi:signal transduction histidine kinase
MRDLVDVEAAPLHRRAQPVPVADLMNQVAESLAALYREASVQLEVQPGADGLRADVDTHQVGRALRNVLANAAQHSPPGATVTLSVSAIGEELVLRVEDRGRGIAREDLPHVFERFYRADPARSSGSAARPGRPGSGIGLTVARELVRANGGEVWVERTGPEGTTVALRLPSAS